jgi:DNA-binding MarR family transcriptional regulator
MNDLVVPWCREQGLEVTRARAYRKNDQAWVEQKNGAIDAGPLSVAQIARDMGLTRRSVQRLANVLAAEGIVSFAENPAHKRAKLVQLTPRGRAMLDRISCIQVDWARQTTDGLTPEELQSASATLRSIRQRLEQAAAAGGETDE